MPVNYWKTIVCLAASRKTGGRCIAGKERGSGIWIRPISARPTAEVHPDELRYEDGTEPELLDAIEIAMISHAPHGHQQENHVFDARYYWIKRGRVECGRMDDLADRPPALWANGYSTCAGRNDRVPAAEAARYRNSLFFVKPQEAAISVKTPGAAFGNPKKALRAAFLYNGALYDMRVTDFNAERRYLSKDVGTYPIDKPCYFCISLTEAHTDGYCYKLVASLVFK